MKVKISELLKISGKSIDINFDDIKIDLENVNINEKIKFVGRVESKEKVLLLTGHITFRYEAVCDRCLEGIEKEVDISISEFAKEYSGNEEEYYYKAGVIDISKPIEDNIILNLPVKHLCREECKGLCPVCGSNVEKFGDCNCSNEEYINPGFEALKNINLD